MKLLQKLDTLLNKAEGGLLVFLLAVMIVLAFAQVVLRNAFSSGILWADILLRHLVLWIGFLGAALAVSHDRHISIDALTRFLPERVKHGVNVLSYLFAAFISFLFFRAALTFMQNEMLDGSTVYAEIPSWYAAIIIPVGFGLLVVHFLIRAVLRARSALKGGEAR